MCSVYRKPRGGIMNTRVAQHRDDRSPHERRTGSPYRGVRRCNRGRSHRRKASERTNRHSLVEGTLVSDSGDENFLYFFSTPYEVNLPEKAMVQLEVDGRVVQGVYV